MRASRALSAVVAATLVLAAPLAAGAQGGPTVAEAGIAAGVAALAEATAGADFTATAEPSVPDDGEPNPILRTAVVGLDVGRTLTADDLAVDPSLGIEVEQPGSTDFLTGNTAVTVVVVELARPPGEGDNAVENLSLAITYPGDEVLATSPFAHDPLLGAGSVVDRGVAVGEAFSSYQRIVDGAWSPFADPIARYTFRTERGWAVAYVVPSAPSRLAAVSSHAATETAESLYAATVELGAATTFVDPGTVDLGPLAQVVLPDPGPTPTDGTSDPAPAPPSAPDDAPEASDDGGTSALPFVIGGVVVLVAAGGAVAVANRNRKDCRKEQAEVDRAQFLFDGAHELAEKYRRALDEVRAAEPPKPTGTDAHRAGEWDEWKAWYEDRYLKQANLFDERVKSRNEAADRLAAAQRALAACLEKPPPAPPPPADEDLDAGRATGNSEGGGPPPRAPRGYTHFDIRLVSGGEGGPIVGGGILTFELRDPEGRTAQYTFVGVGFTFGTPAGYGPSPDWTSFTTTSPLFVHEFECYGSVSAAGIYGGVGGGTTECIWYLDGMYEQRVRMTGQGTGAGAGASQYYGWFELRD